MTAESEALLAPLRTQIDAIDSRMVALLADRMACVRQVVAIKQAEKIPARLPVRVDEVVARVRGEAMQAGVHPELAEVLWRTMIEWIIAFEDDQLDSNDPPSGVQAK